MNNDQMKNEINESMKLLDGFDQVVVPDGLAKSITGKMSQEYKSQTTSRMFFKISASVAAVAAVLIIGFILFANSASETESVKPKQIADVNNVLEEADAVFAQLIVQENNAYGFYDDLNFEISQTSKTAQLAQNDAASQPTTLSGDDEWDTMLLSMFADASSS